MEENLIKINSDNVPRRLDSKNGYSQEQRKQIAEMMKIYRNVVYYAGVCSGFGSELDSPNVGALEILLEVKRQADLLPSSFKKFDPESFEAIETAIDYCQKRRLF